MPVASFISISTATHSGTGTGAITKPSGTADGDILLYLFSRQQITGAYSSGLTGWTQLLTAQDSAATVQPFRSWLFWKLASSEPANYTPVFTTSSTSASTMMCFRGQHATPWDDTDFSIPSGTTGLASPTLTVSGNNRLAILIAALERSGSSPGDWVAAVTGMTNRLDFAGGAFHFGVWTAEADTGSFQKNVDQAGVTTDTLIWAGALTPADASDPASGRSQVIFL